MKLVVLAVVLVPAVAFAQPALTPPITPAPEPQYYVAPSLEVGGNDPVGAIFGGFALDGGYRLSGNWWLHGKGLVARSNASTWGDQKPSGNLDTIAAGIEWRHRWILAGMDGVLVRDKTPDGSVAEYFGPALAGHFGIEVGSPHIKFRPEFEWMMGGKQHLPDTIVTKDYVVAGVSFGVAYIW